VVPAVLVVVVATIGLGQTTPAFALNAAEQTYVDQINGLRASLGLRQLIVDPQLSAIAHQHDLDMAAAGHLYHSANLAAGITVPWRALAENIGMRTPGGPDLWQAFLNSPGHYANIVNPAFTHVGIGDDVINGNEWTTQRFMQAAAPATPSAPAPKPPPVVYHAPAPTPAPSTTRRQAATTTAPPAPTSTAALAPADEPDPADLPPPPPQADVDHVAAVVAVLQTVRS
jgi:hypothetical protein